VLTFIRKETLRKAMAYEKSKQDSYKVKPFGSRGIASKRRSKSLLKENPSGFYNGL
jgi:hypothetical protein